MKKVLLVLVAVSVQKLNAQPCFSNPANYSVGNSPNQAVSADFNGDAKKDLGVVNSASNDVSVLLGTGTGSFGAPTNFAVGGGPFSLVAADFNEDGNMDLVVANSHDDNVTVLLGTGAGSFGTGMNFSVGNAPWFVTSADFNGDQHADLVVANDSSSNVSVLLGTGSGSFSAAVNYYTVYPGTSRPVSVTCADFNGDGKIDLAVPDQADIWIMLGNGDGTFNAPTFVVAGSFPWYALSEDFNGDGKMDLAVANNDSPDISVLLGTGTGGFDTAVNYMLTGFTYANSMACKDYNGDGKLDLAVASFSSTSHDSIRILFGTGAGTFSSPFAFNTADYPSGICSADFNGDGMPDLATSANISLGAASILLNCMTPPPCIASVTDSLFNISPLNWGILPHYSSQITNATWCWGDGSSTSGLYPSHTYTAAGRYTICVTAFTSCGDSVSTCRNDSIYRNASSSSMVNVQVVQNASYVKHIEGPTSFAIYPNPAADFVNIRSNAATDLIVTLYDIHGRTVFCKKAYSEVQIDVSELQPGVYDVVVTSTKEVCNKKLIILR